MIPAIVRPMQRIVMHDGTVAVMSSFHGRRFSTETIGIDTEKIKTQMEDFSKRLSDVEKSRHSDALQVAELKGERKDDLGKFFWGGSIAVGSAILGGYHIKERIRDNGTLLSKRIDDTNKKIDDKFHALEKRMDDKFQFVNDKFQNVDKRLDSIENTLKEISTKLHEKK